MSPVIGFAGLSHLGIVSSLCAAEKGFDVVAFDREAALVGQLTRGKMPVSEPGLDALWLKNRNRIRFTAEISSLARCDVIYISADIATDAVGQSDLAEAEGLLCDVLAVSGSGAAIIVLSQVFPGFMRAHLQSSRPMMYQVETLIFGRAVMRALEPERIIVGCLEPDKPLPLAYAKFLNSFDCPLLVMRFESAELAKIAINMFLVASVTTANALAELCEAIGADWKEISGALRLDARIGPRAYLAAGLGLSGGNLERDLATFCEQADRHNTDSDVVRAWLRQSTRRKDWPWRVACNALGESIETARIAVLGLAYKEDTHSTKNAPSLQLLRHLTTQDTLVYDPIVQLTDGGARTVQVKDALSAVRDADVVFIMTPWAEFRGLVPSELAARMRGRWIIDPYGMVDLVRAKAAGLAIISLGTGQVHPAPGVVTT